MARKFGQRVAIAAAVCAVAPGMALAQAAAGAPTDRPQQAPPPNNQSADEAARLMPQTGGSLLRASLAAQPDPDKAPLEGVSFFAVPEPEPKVIRKHDLVTIIVREESQFKSEGNTELSKEASFNSELNDFFRLSTQNFGLVDALGEPKLIDLNGKREFNGEASVDRTDSFTTRVTAEVLDVKPNGTMVLQARKRIITDEEEQIVVLTGTCRVEDVSIDNSVLSTQLYDAEVKKTHKGAVRDNTKRGWLPKLLDAINPF